MILLNLICLLNSDFMEVWLIRANRRVARYSYYLWNRDCRKFGSFKALRSVRPSLDVILESNGTKSLL